MNKIFKNKKAKEGTVMAAAPEEPETPGEIKQIEELSGNLPTQGVTTEQQEVTPSQPQERQQVPVCMSQTQINNMIIDMDMKLNYIISKIESD